MNAKTSPQKSLDLPATARSLPIALVRAREKVMGPIRKMLADSGLTEQQWRVLRVLAEMGEVDASTLSHSAAIMMPSQTRIVQALQERGLVTRVADAGDRRKQLIKITNAGLGILKANEAEAAALQKSVRDALGEERIEALLNLLQDVEDKLP